MSTPSPPSAPLETVPGDDSLAAYDYALPPSSIAQRPADRRDDARLMVLDLAGPAAPRDHWIRDLPSLLRGDELLVLNDTRVVPARLRGRKVPTGGAVELLVVEADDPTRREVVVMARSSKKLRVGAVIDVGGEGQAEALVTVVEALGAGRYRVALPDEAPDLHAFLGRLGDLPLPPYIERTGGATAEDATRYQTTFARAPGAVAAPTAGLHFTPELLEAIRARGCEIATVTLHVGPGTFQPVRVANLDAHEMHAERYVIPPETAAAVTQAREQGRPVLAVGTTVVRALEAAAAAAASEPGDTGTLVRPGPGETALFIRPGYAFRVVDQLMTNFHLPGSTLLMLVSALVGRERLLDAYRQAISRGYRFYSYGDGMLLR